MLDPDFDPLQALHDLSFGQLEQSALVREISEHITRQAQIIQRLTEQQRLQQLRVDILEKMIFDLCDVVNVKPQ